MVRDDRTGGEAASGPRLVDLSTGTAVLDGEWEFYPGDHHREDLDALTADSITVPGLWEAQGYLELDGVAWYRLRFSVADVSGFCTLHFAAVMDFAEVFLNGIRLGAHEHPFTPFDFPVTGIVAEGPNVLDVKVFDPEVTSPEHIRSAHGKQGWANNVFPSRPSLYMTYGGIWQSVTLRRHGSVVARHVFVNSDPEDLDVTVEVRNLSDEPAVARVGVRTVGRVHEQHVTLPPGERRAVVASFGATPAARWSPDSPALHSAMVDIAVNGVLTDRRHVRFGLRRVTVEGSWLCIDGAPYRMKSCLVQGFRADTLYAEGSREQIVEEVRTAKAMGFTMLRLHIKGFDPRYLDVCDELGMLLECDLPVAEPIAHSELSDGTEVSRRCTEAVVEQIQRDRNHPSIVLWSTMNELGLDGPGSRDTDAYEQFARTLYAAAQAADPTRPIIENEWVEPDPERVFCSPILTAHWYGRLHADYLDKLERESRRWVGMDRPLYISEFGDWGLPAMPEIENAPFWDTRQVYSAGLAGTPWPSTVNRFVRETQRYQGLSDRMQIEVFRRHDHIGGYCLTELTDVPHELNGLLDLHRAPKPIAVQEVTRANQPRLPMLDLRSLVTVTGGLMQAAVHVANDGPPLSAVTIDARFGNAVAIPVADLPHGEDLPAAHLERQFTESVAAIRVGELPGYAASPVGVLSIVAPEVPGTHDLIVTLRTGGAFVAENRYPISVISEWPAVVDVQVVGSAESTAATAAAVAAVGGRVGDGGPAVVAEGGLDGATGRWAADHLAAGGTLVVLAQTPEAAAHYPLPAEIVTIETAWGSSTFHFTTDSGALASFPRRRVLAGEENTVQAGSVVVSLGGQPFPEEPVVVAFKPVPDALTGTVVGGHPVGGGSLILCQYRLVNGVTRGDVAARAVLADLLRWAATPRAPMSRAETSDADGRRVTYYSYPASYPAGSPPGAAGDAQSAAGSGASRGQ